eukprot:COSAG02_NODE_7528_length_2972_cov_3.618169_1_plen_383_part_00
MKQNKLTAFYISFAQLCTEDGETLWHANQADNIDDGQLRELAYQWNDVKQAKLNKISWPDAAHLASLLLDEDLALRPATWNKVLQHPFLAAEMGTTPRKRIVMSCPEMGTINANNSGPYDQNVMEKVSHLQQIGFVKFGFDRAGTSTAREKDGALFDKAFALLDEGKRGEAIELLKSTDWWYGYQTSVKQAVKLECQGFDGILDVTCIQGGFITQLEAAEMERIMVEAKADCAKSHIDVQYEITEVSYYEFLMDYEPVLHTDDQILAKQHQVQQALAAVGEEPDCDRHGNASVTIESSEAVEVATHERDLHFELAEAWAQLAAKDEELLAKDEELAKVTAVQEEQLAAKDAEVASVVAAKDKELQQLRAQLARLEGVPPQRD